MFLPRDDTTPPLARLRHLIARSERSRHRDAGPYKVIIIVVVIVLSILLVGGIFLFRRYKRKGLSRGRYIPARGENNDHNLPSTTPVATSEAQAPPAAHTANQGTGNVDRNTSVRSVMTLPAYRPRASDNEHVLGREGERDGIDVVVEMPTVEDEENLRDNEMDTLYQIREARRRQIAAREERRQARRTARQQGDQLALRNLRLQARNATSQNQEEIDALRETLELTKQTRQRAVSSVSYGDLGVARHDGTRIRANSNESERIGLLSDAASMTVSQRSPSSLSQNFPVSAAHRRGGSVSSVLTIDTMQSDSLHQIPSQNTTRSRASSAGGHTQAGSSPELIDAADADLADLPLNSPPGYEEVSLNELTPAASRSTSPYPERPPDYTSGPTEERNRRLSAHVADIAAEATVADASSSGSGAAPVSASSNDGSRGSGRSAQNSAIPQLPSLRMAHLPQIVIEPSSAFPSDHQPEGR